jgi:hypothetical protein
MKRTKKIVTFLIVFCMAAVLFPTTAFAASARVNFSATTSGTGNSIKVRSVTYEKDFKEYYDNYIGEFDIKFSTLVSWKRTAKVSVKDDQGKRYDAWLADRDNNDCEVEIENPKAGRTYSITINGVKKRGTRSYRKLMLKVSVPSEKASGKKVKVSRVTVDEDNDDYDNYGTEIDVKFATKVKWRRNARISSVKDNKGKSYKAILTEKDSDDCEIYIRNIKYGRTYKIKISGVKARGASSYETVTVTVKVPVRSNKISVKKVKYEEDYDDGMWEYVVDIEFNKRVRHKGNSYVVIKDSSGKTYSSRNTYVDWDGDECEIHLSRGLTYGKTYTYKIVNVKANGESKYTTLKGNFTVY